jgi:hypothetical protein
MLSCRAYLFFSAKNLKDTLRFCWQGSIAGRQSGNQTALPE